MSEMTKENRKVHLIYDGHRTHLRYSAVHIFREGNIMVYCLPSHPSDETQQLDVKLFGPFKNYLNAAISAAVRAVDKAEIDMFDLFHFAIKAYRKAFRPKMFYLLSQRRISGLRVLSLY